MSLRLNKYVKIEGVLVCKTGLRIGSSKDDIEIGGMDNPILRDPLTKLPYVPGSSLKGKLRSALEYRYCAEQIGGGEPCGCGRDTCPVCRIFGPHRNVKHDLGPTRIIVRDAQLTAESQRELKLNLEGDAAYTELKQEVSIDRRMGTASRAGPRTMERIPAGAKFDLNISLRVFDGDDEKAMVGYIQEGLELLQKDYLGASGTRGYGWVKVEKLSIT